MIKTKIMLGLSVISIAACSTSNNTLEQIQDEKNNKVLEKIDLYNESIENINETIEESQEDFMDRKHNLDSSLKEYLENTAEVSSYLYSGAKPFSEENDEIENEVDGMREGLSEMLKEVSGMKNLHKELEENKIIYDYLDEDIAEMKNSDIINDATYENYIDLKTKLKKSKSSNYMTKMTIERDVIRHIDFIEREKDLYKRMEKNVVRGGFYDIPRHHIANTLNAKTPLAKTTTSKPVVKKSNPVVKNTEVFGKIKIKDFDINNQSHKESIFYPMDKLLRADKKANFKIESFAKTPEEALDKAVSMIDMLDEMSLPSDRMSVQTTAAENIKSPYIIITKE